MPFDQMNLFADHPAADYRDSLTDVDRATIEAAKAVLQRLCTKRPLISSWTALTDYLSLSQDGLRVEVFKVLFLDRKNALITEEVFGRGTVDHCPVYPREVARRAVALDASAVIVTHNHPSGDATPSDADKSMTRQLADTMQAVGIVLHDHVITGGGKPLSMRSEGLL